MLLVIDDVEINIDDKYIWYSPYLSTLATTEMGVDKDEQDRIILYDIDMPLLKAYIRFLETGNLPPSLSWDMAELLDMMGHHNHMRYALDVWRMKLQDNWIRDNFYRLELYNDPMHGLIEVPIVRQLPIDVPKGWYVAGGAALWMAGIIDKLNDIDLFTSLDNDDELRNSMKFLNTTMSRDEYIEQYTNEYLGVEDVIRYMGKHNELYKVSVGKYVITYRKRSPIKKERISTQMILRRYKCLCETLYGFDVDCVSIAYVPKGTYIGNGKYQHRDAIYMTDRADYSIKSRCNWLDPERASPSYAHRLVKYKARGFNIFLPLMTEYDLDNHSIGQYYKKISNLYIRANYSDFDHLDNRGDKYITGKNIFKEYVQYIPIYNMIRFLYMIGYRHDLKMDQQSMLILATYKNIYITNTEISDYGGHPKEPSGRKWKGQFIVDFDKIQWVVQDPMKQVTTTINSIPIDDIRSWYSKSPFFMVD